MPLMVMNDGKAQGSRREQQNSIFIFSRPPSEVDIHTVVVNAIIYYRSNMQNGPQIDRFIGCPGIAKRLVDKEDYCRKSGKTHFDSKSAVKITKSYLFGRWCSWNTCGYAVDTDNCNGHGEIWFYDLWMCVLLWEYLAIIRGRAFDGVAWYNAEEIMSRGNLMERPWSVKNRQNKWQRLKCMIQNRVMLRFGFCSVEYVNRL